LLEQYQSIRLTVNFLIFNLPKLQPRFYSISSSPKMKSNEIDITLLVIEYRPLKGKTMHYGVCSKLLDQMTIGETLYGFIRRFE
jgi:nitric-oxide synthase, brain